MSRICILGGTGFVGRVLASRLARDGHQLTVLTRSPHRHRAMLVLPGLRLLAADVHRKDALFALTEGADVLINLVGILNETRAPGQTFQQAHTTLAHHVSKACLHNEIPRLLQMSALGADRAAPSRYLRSKAEAEQTALNLGETAHVTYFRPSVIFGPGDHFFTRFAALLRLAPGVFPLACPDSRFAPVYVGDVAERMRASLTDPATYRRAVGLCGPQEYTLRELVELTARMCGLRRTIVPLPDRLSRLQARLLGLLPGKPFTIDNYRSLQVDSVCAGEAPCPTHVEPIMLPALQRGARPAAPAARGHP